MLVDRQEDQCITISRVPVEYPSAVSRRTCIYSYEVNGA